VIETHHEHTGDFKGRTAVMFDISSTKSRLADPLAAANSKVGTCVGGGRVNRLIKRNQGAPPINDES
jgi:hypothetical protein